MFCFLENWDNLQNSVWLGYNLDLLSRTRLNELLTSWTGHPTGLAHSECYEQGLAVDVICYFIFIVAVLLLLLCAPESTVKWAPQRSALS